MCAIIDNDVVHEAFGDRRTEAGTKFREWLDRGGSPLVVGGKLLDELDGNTDLQGVAIHRSPVRPGPPDQRPDGKGKDGRA